MTCLERSKQIGKLIVLNFTLFDCLTTWRKVNCLECQSRLKNGCICQITKWIASSARSSSAIERSELLVNKIYFTLPNLSALVREAYNVTCLERSKQFGKKDCTQLRLNDCLATWRELHRPVYAARNIRSSEHVCCICQRIMAEWLSSCIYQFNVLCFTPLQYHKCLQYKFCCAIRVMTPTM